MPSRDVDTGNGHCAGLRHPAETRGGAKHLRRMYWVFTLILDPLRLPFLTCGRRSGQRLAAGARRADAEESIHRRTDHDGARQAEAGTAVDEVCRRLGVSETSLYRWKKRSGTRGPGARELRRLQEENRKPRAWSPVWAWIERSCRRPCGKNGEAWRSGYCLTEGGAAGHEGGTATVVGRTSDASLRTVDGVKRNVTAGRTSPGPVMREQGRVTGPAGRRRRSL